MSDGCELVELQTLSKPWSLEGEEQGLQGVLEEQLPTGTFWARHSTQGV